MERKYRRFVFKDKLSESLSVKGGPLIIYAQSRREALRLRNLFVKNARNVEKLFSLPVSEVSLLGDRLLPVDLK